MFNIDLIFLNSLNSSYITLSLLIISDSYEENVESLTFTRIYSNTISAISSNRLVPARSIL